MTNISVNTNFQRPFLKWAGGKFQIIQRIVDALPPAERLVEPFVGSGVVFLNTDYQDYRLSDINPDLIYLYRILQQKGDAFIERCQKYFHPRYNQEAIYYQLRQEFNQLKPGSVKRAALFVYLNRHGYNGLCRYNSSGIFNVPYGRYKKPYFPRSEMQAFHLKASKVEFVCSDFKSAIRKATPGSVIYCDPPYIPLNPTASFTSYAKQSFGLDKQSQLAAECIKAGKRGIPVIISNHDTPLSRELYQAAKLDSFEVRRYISCNGQSRLKVGELLAHYQA